MHLGFPGQEVKEAFLDSTGTGSDRERNVADQFYLIKSPALRRPVSGRSVLLQGSMCVSKNREGPTTYLIRDCPFCVKERFIFGLDKPILEVWRKGGIFEGFLPISTTYILRTVQRFSAYSFVRALSNPGSSKHGSFLACV